jgi:hypothetical protein
MRPGHHDPFRRRTQTNPPTDASMPLDLASPELLPSSEITTNKQKPKEKNKTKNTLISKKSISAVHSQVAKNCPKPRFHEQMLVLFKPKNQKEQNP